MSGLLGTIQRIIFRILAKLACNLSRLCLLLLPVLERERGFLLLWKKSLEIPQKFGPPWTRRARQFAIGKLLGFIQIPPPSRLQIYLVCPPEPCFEDEFVDDINQREQRQKDVGIHKPASVKWTKIRPALHQSEEDIGAKSKIGAPGVKHGDEGEIGNCVPLSFPRLAEADVREADAAPDEKGRDAREVDDVFVGLPRARGYVHHAEGATEVGQDNGWDGHATLVCPAEYLGGLTVLAHVQQGSGTNVDAAVDGRETSNENEGVDEMHPSVPSCILDRNRHGAL